MKWASKSVRLARFLSSNAVGVAPRARASSEAVVRTGRRQARGDMPASTAVDDGLGLASERLDVALELGVAKELFGELVERILEAAVDVDLHRVERRGKASRVLELHRRLESPG